MEDQSELMREKTRPQVKTGTREQTQRQCGWSGRTARRSCPCGPAGRRTRNAQWRKPAPTLLARQLGPFTSSRPCRSPRSWRARRLQQVDLLASRLLGGWDGADCRRRRSRRASTRCPSATADCCSRTATLLDQASCPSPSGRSRTTAANGLPRKRCGAPRCSRCCLPTSCLPHGVLQPRDESSCGTTRGSRCSCSFGRANRRSSSTARPRASRCRCWTSSPTTWTQTTGSISSQRLSSLGTWTRSRARQGAPA